MNLGPLQEQCKLLVAEPSSLQPGSMLYGGGHHPFLTLQWKAQHWTLTRAYPTAALAEKIPFYYSVRHWQHHPCFLQLLNVHNTGHWVGQRKTISSEGQTCWEGNVCWGHCLKGRSDGPGPSATENITANFSGSHVHLLGPLPANRQSCSSPGHTLQRLLNDGQHLSFLGPWLG